jgi:hypothetical protein
MTGTKPPIRSGLDEGPHAQLGLVPAKDIFILRVTELRPQCFVGRELRNRGRC